MHKAITFLLFLLAAMLLAGLFGAVHDQISYTVSPEYYTRFKFIQFNLQDADVPPRLRAAQVGFLASWWMGIPLAILTFPAALIHRSPHDMRLALAWSPPVMAAFTLVFALAGLAYGYVQTRGGDPASSGWFIPENVQDPRRFLCAGYMHNAAYMGGALAIAAGWAFHMVYRFRG